MAAVNFVLLLALLTSVNAIIPIAIPNPIFDKYDIRVGENDPESAILLQLDVHHQGYVVPHTTNIVYPPDGMQRGDLIKYIEIKDKKPSGNGGTARIVAGGVGFDHVHIKITSPILNGINTKVLVKGEPRWWRTRT